MGVNIRSARREDIDQVLALWKEFMGDSTSMDRPIPTHEENARIQREFIAKLIEANPAQVQVAEEGGELVGYATFQETAKTPVETAYKWAFITDLYVRPSHRMRGLGDGLVRACLGYLRAHGCKHVRLTVWVKNETAIRMYRRLGFGEKMHVLQADL